MHTYLVTWEMEIDADSPEAAAQQALVIHRDPNSLATVFRVTDHTSHMFEIDALDGTRLEVSRG